MKILLGCILLKLSNVVNDRLLRLNLSLKNMHGQCYDGAASQEWPNKPDAG